MEIVLEKEKKAALAVGVVTAFITSFFGSALNLAVPEMSEYFHMGASSVGWIISIYMLIVAGFSTPIGKIADSTGRRRILILGIAIFGIMCFAAVWSPAGEFLIAARGLQGIGASMIFATNMPIAISMFPPQERGKIIGKVTAGTYTGLALGPVLGGFFNSWLGWKSIFFFGGIVSFAAFAAVLLGLKSEAHETAKMKVDVPGNLIYIVMLTAIIYGLTALNTVSFAWMLLAGGLLLIPAFAKVELASDNPVIDVRIFKNSRTFTMSNLTALFNYSATFGLGYLLSIYLQVVMGYSSRTAGLILIAQPFFMAILTPKMGSLSDRIAPYKLASGGMALIAAALLVFTFISEDMPVWLIFLTLSVAGIGIAMFSSPNTNVAMGCVHPSKFGVANSILSTMRNTGQAAGMAIITMTVSAMVGNVSLYEVSAGELLRTMHVAFAVFTVLCMAGAIMSLSRSRIHDENK